MIRCQTCGYSNKKDTRICIRCKSLLTLSEDENKGAESPTQPVEWEPKNPDQPALLALSKDASKQVLRAIPLKGASEDDSITVELTRNLLEKDNDTISRQQATLVYKEGSWWIENRSEKKSTFIQVNGQLKLSDGDELILGNALFRFTSKLKEADNK